MRAPVVAGAGLAAFNLPIDLGSNLKSYIEKWFVRACLWVLRTLTIMHKTGPFTNSGVSKFVR